MRAATLRKQINIEVPVEVKSVTGAVTKTWQSYRSKVWASIETLRGYERQTAVATWPSADVKIEIRYIAGLLPTMRIVYDNKVYSILGINNVEERNREMIITTQTGVKSA